MDSDSELVEWNIQKCLGKKVLITNVLKFKSSVTCDIWRTMHAVAFILQEAKERPFSRV